MNISNIRTFFISLIVDLKNDSRFDDIVFNHEVSNGKPLLTAKDNRTNNIAVVTLSGGVNSFKIEHWADIPHTAFNLGQPHELVLTSFIEISDDSVSKIKEILISAFKYESAYLQWKESDKYRKIIALPFDKEKLGTLHDDQVLVSIKEDDLYIVTNKFQKTFSFSKIDFFNRFDFKDSNHVN